MNRNRIILTKPPGTIAEKRVILIKHPGTIAGKRVILTKHPGTIAKNCVILMKHPGTIAEKRVILIKHSGTIIYFPFKSEDILKIKDTKTSRETKNERRMAKQAVEEKKNTRL